MLSSKYAPTIALAVLGIVIVFLLGWFLAISPQLSEASDLRSDTTTLRTNTAMIQTDIAALAQYEAELDERSVVATAREFNAPARLDVETFRTRMNDAIQTSGVELAEASQAPAAQIVGWEVDASMLTSTAVAQRFQSGPAATTTVTPQEFTPAVVAPNGTTVPAADVAEVPFTFNVVGTPSEVRDFLDLLQDPEAPLFLMSNVGFEGLAEGDNVGEGLSAPSNGDLLVTIGGTLFLSHLDTSLVDEGPLATIDAVPSDAFAVPNSEAGVDEE
ncbi:hypothetical protein [Demequina sp. NBRC 110055]|uniref:hypothetical protein n=1 Tax=Demequina sp. NBRC 110055 TaxID=1570344 RepID=UPI000A01BF66|nr:hypothetical protein [Demequina sp. NBRC 110055]